MPRICLWLVAVGLAACALAPRHPYEMGEGFEPAAVRRVYLAPLNATRPLAEELEPGAERTRALIESYLESRDRSYVSGSLYEYRSLRQWAFGEAKLAGPRPGKPAAVPREVMALLFDALRQRYEFDALLVPDLVGRPARLSGRMAYWDGVSRRQEGDYVVATGHVKGVSLRLRMFDADGQRVFESHGGLDLLVRPSATSVREHVPREGTYPLLRLDAVDQLLGDGDNLREGVAVAFHPFLEFRR